MLNSSNYSREEGILNSGQVIAQDLDMGADAVTYLSPVAGMNFFMPDGAQLIFTGGVYRTSNKHIIAELDKIAGTPTGMIRREATGVSAQAVAAVELARAAADASTTAGSAQIDATEAQARVQQARVALGRAGAK